MGLRRPNDKRLTKNGEPVRLTGMPLSVQKSVQSEEKQTGTVDLSSETQTVSGEGWDDARDGLTTAIRDMVGQVRQLRQENLVLRGELRQSRLRESGLREERAVLLRDLNHSLETVEKTLDLMAVNK